jgi:hypothetical protein
MGLFSARSSGSLLVIEYTHIYGHYLINMVACINYADSNS